jgi:hypothetical protein
MGVDETRSITICPKKFGYNWLGLLSLIVHVTVSSKSNVIPSSDIPFWAIGPLDSSLEVCLSFAFMVELRPDHFHSSASRGNAPKRAGERRVGGRTSTGWCLFRRLFAGNLCAGTSCLYSVPFYHLYPLSKVTHTAVI